MDADVVYIPALIMLLAFVAVIITPLAKVAKRLAAPVVYVVYVTAVGISTAAARSSASEMERVYQLAA